MKKKVRESLYTEYERFICNEMDDKEKLKYIKSRNFNIVNRIFLDLK